MAGDADSWYRGSRRGRGPAAGGHAGPKGDIGRSIRRRLKDLESVQGRPSNRQHLPSTIIVDGLAAAEARRSRTARHGWTDRLALWVTCESGLGRSPRIGPHGWDA